MDRNLLSYLEQNQQLLNSKRLLGKIVPPGTVVDFGGTTAPDGWVLCDGSTYDATTSPDKYLDLWNAIGILHGGTGQSSFKVPDTRGRVVAGYAASGGHTDVATVGNSDATALASRRPKHSHTHTLTLPNHTHNFTAVIATGGATAGGVGATSQSTGTTTNPNTLPAITGAVGLTGTADTPSYIVLAQIIKL